VHRLINDLQAIAIAAEISTASPPFRYLLKRAYVAYVTAWPLHGAMVFPVEVLGHVFSRNGANDKVDPQGYLNAYLAVSPCGMFLLSRKDEDEISSTVGSDASGPPGSPSDPSKPKGNHPSHHAKLMFECSLDDIESISMEDDDEENPSQHRPVRDSVRLSRASISSSIYSDFDDDIPDADKSLRVVFDINGMTIAVKISRPSDLVRHIETCTLEALGRGDFPHGLEGGIDLVELGTHLVPQSDPREAWKAFLRDLPILPTPPVPVTLLRGDVYVEAPKSRREIMAEERAEEERLEREQARLAAEAQIEKRQRLIEQGRKKISEDNDSDDENDPHASRRKSRKRLGSRRGTRNARGSYGGAVGGLLSQAEALQARIEAATCGVPEVHQMYLAHSTQRLVPHLPAKVGGIVKMDAHFYHKPAEKVVIKRTNAKHPWSLVPAAANWDSGKATATAGPGAKMILLPKGQSNPSSPTSALLAASKQPHSGWSSFTRKFKQRNDDQNEKVLDAQNLIATKKAPGYSGEGGVVMLYGK
jgi:hypothetical protein